MAMVQINESQLARLGEQVTASRALAQKLRDQVKSKAVQDNAVMLATATAAAGGFGFLRGRMEGPSGAWNVPGTTIDVEVVAVVALGAVALGGGMLHKSLKKLEGPASHACAGIAGHLVGQIARKYGKTGQLSLVAGRGYGMLPSPGAGDQTPGFLDTQIGPPFADPIAEALARGGV